MATLQFVTAVDYHGKAQYRIETEDLQPGPLGIIFRSSALVNADGSFDVCLVPWQNIVSYTHAMNPADMVDESDDDTVQ